MSAPKVLILAERSDRLEQLKACGELLEEFGVAYAARLIEPAKVHQAVRQAEDQGVRILVVPSGTEFVLAAGRHTALTVVAVPLERTSGAKGIEWLSSVLKRPAPEAPASVALGRSGAKNAAHLAARILALSDSRLSAAVEDHKDRQRTKVLNTKVSA